MNDFNEKALTAISRFQNDIFAYKVLSVTDNSITVLRKKDGELVREAIPLIDAKNNFHPGDFIDLIIRSKRFNGREVSCEFTVVGRTPPNFAF